MRFSILTDIHLGPEQYCKGILRKINKDVKLYLENYIDEMNNNTKPEFVIILGDLIQDDNPENDKENVANVVKILSRLNSPVYYVTGNHDLKNISETELKNIFKLDKLYYSFDNQGYHFIVLFSKKVNPGEIMIEDDQIEWLKNDLNNSDKKCIIFVHHGLADQDLTGNPWFDGKPESALVKNRVNVRKIINESKKVIAVFNSHIHWDRKNIHDSIPYYTIQSLTENEDDKGIASEAYAVVDVINDKLSVKVEGNYSKSL